MPGFISHISYLKKFWEEMNFPESFLWDGILGNILPDIRYITRQNRKITHFGRSFRSATTYGQLFNNVLEDIENKLSNLDAPQELLAIKISKAGFKRCIDLLSGKRFPKIKSDFNRRSDS